MTSARSHFMLSTGRSVGLQFLEQWQVYAGLLEGLPTKEGNDAELKRLVEKTSRQDGHPPLLITPVQEPIQYEGHYPFGEPAKLPPIACTGRFQREVGIFSLEQGGRLRNALPNSGPEADRNEKVGGHPGAVAANFSSGAWRFWSAIK